MTSQDVTIIAESWLLTELPSFGSAAGTPHLTSPLKRLRGGDLSGTESPILNSQIYKRFSGLYRERVGVKFVNVLPYLGKIETQTKFPGNLRKMPGQSWGLKICSCVWGLFKGGGG